MKSLAVLFAGMLVLGAAAPTMGQTAVPEVPAATGETGLFDLLTGNTLPERAWSIGLYYNNRDRLIDLGSADDLEHDWDRLSVSLGYGVRSNWEVAVQVPFWDDFAFHHDTLLIGQELDANGFNNIRVGTNYQFFRDDATGAVASVNGFIELPTGDEELASETGYGFGVAGHMRQVVYNFGFRDPGDGGVLDSPQEVRAGVGFSRPMTDRLDWISELIATFLTGGENRLLEMRNAFDLSSGGRLRLANDSPWSVNFALRVNVNGLSGVGGALGVTYAAQR